jgi:hypothetical protein
MNFSHRFLALVVALAAVAGSVNAARSPFGVRKTTARSGDLVRQHPEVVTTNAALASALALPRGGGVVDADNYVKAVRVL